MENLKISCPCLFGLESVLTGEMKRMGAQNITAEDGRVTFEGTFADVVRANLRLRTAERGQIISTVTSRVVLTRCGCSLMPPISAPANKTSTWIFWFFVAIRLAV